MLVSVVIPCYNRKKALLAAVDSVLAQTCQDFEIIVVDDGSAPAQRLKQGDFQIEKLRYFRRPHRGVSAARNFGAAAAEGKYLAFLDSDDLWDRRKLEKQVECLRRSPGYHVCYTDEKWLRCGEHLNQHKKHRKYHGNIFEKCLPLCIISASSILMEKAVFDELGGFDEKLPACEDYDLWLRLALRYPVAFLDEKLIIKQGGQADQLSRRYWGMDRFRVRALEKLLKNGLSRGQRAAVLGELRKKYGVLLAGSRKRRRWLRWLFYKLRSIIVLK